MSFPFYEQHDIKDCGPACLKVIADHYGRNYSLNFLRSICYIGKNGVSLRGISYAANNIGFNTTGISLSYDQLTKIKFPCIAHWNNNHFIVIYKIKRDKVYVSDPGFGLLKYRKEDFIKGWISSEKNAIQKGIILLIEKTDSFYLSDGELESHQVGKFTFLKRFIKKFKSFFINIAFSLLLSSIILLIFPLLTQSIVDIGIKEKSINFVWLILLGQLVFIIGKASIEFIRNRILFHIGYRVNISLATSFLKKMIKLPMFFFDSRLTGDFIQRIEDNARIENFLTSQSIATVFNILSIFVLSLVLLYYDLKIFIIFWLFSVIYVFWICFFLKKRKVIDHLRFELYSNNKNKIYHLLDGMQEIKLQNCGNRKINEWELIRIDIFNLFRKKLNYEQIQDVGGILISEIRNILITVIAATSVISNDITLGMMLSIQYIIGQLNSPIEQTLKFIYELQDVTLSVNRINEIYSLKEENDISKKIPELENSIIIINGLSFKYGGPYSKSILHNINITIPENRVTAIVGQSGSGKTTLIKLLLGSYPFYDGKIIIGNRNLNSFDLDWWRMQCGAVMQDGFIFSDSIAQNIAISEDNINNDKLIIAAKIANIHDYIMKLPLSYNTIIGQEGQGLSQGQKQRILIARAVYKDPSFIFLDEATNSLDADNERTIVENLNSFYKNRTVIIVAHRLSTVKNADQIIVLKDGEPIEIGIHCELIKRKGYYYNLVKNQLEIGS